ncbi:MAG: ABC transporter substrate-binding protein [Egibacteraceae bacterium]
MRTVVLWKMLLLLAVLGLLAAACAPGEPVAGPDDPDVDQADDVPEDSDDLVALTLQHMEVPPERVDAFQRLIDRFNEEQDQYFVTQQTVGWDEAYARATAQIAAGEAPEMLQAIPAFFTTIRETGTVQPATEIFEELSENHTFIPAMVEQYDWDGEIWAIPAFSMVEGLWYNAQHFEEAGLEPPTTWGEVLEATEALTGDGRFGITVPTGDSFATVQAIYTWMGANQAEDIYDDDCAPIVDDPRTVETFEFFEQLAEYSPPDSPAYTWAEVESALVAGRTSMITFKGSFLRAWEQDSGLPPEALRMVPIPQPDDGGQEFSLSYSNAIMVMTDDPVKQEGIKEFMDFFLRPDVYGEWLGEAEPGLFLPVTEEGEEAETFWESPIIADFDDEMRTQLEINRTSALYGFTQDAYCPEVGEFEGQFLLAKAVERMIVEGMSPAEAAAWLQEQMEQIDV